MDIFLASDQKEKRSTLKQLLERGPEWRVVGEAEGMDHLIEGARRMQPDMILLDWELPGANHSLPAALRAACPRVKIIAFSVPGRRWQEAMIAGVDAFVSKTEPQELLLKTMYTAAGLSRPFPG